MCENHSGNGKGNVETISIQVTLAEVLNEILARLTHIQGCMTAVLTTLSEIRASESSRTQDDKGCEGER